MSKHVIRLDVDDFGKEVIMSVYALKIKVDGNGSKVISILRKLDPSLSIGEIRKRMQSDGVKGSTPFTKS